jgi:glucose dehydrogenase
MNRLIQVRLRPICILILALAIALPGFAQEPSWQRLINSDKEPQNWLSYGGNYAAHRYSSLNQITPANVKNLAPAWMFPTGEVRGGLNATPIVMDGVMYLMGPMNRVFAINAATGELSSGNTFTS